MRINILFIGLFLFAIIACRQDRFLETTDKSRLTDGTIWESGGNADGYRP